LTTLLSKNSNITHLLAGADNIKDFLNRIPPLLHKQILYLGVIFPIKPYIKTINLYSSCIGVPSGRIELEIMLQSKPIVVMQQNKNEHSNVVAEVVKISKCVVPKDDLNDYISKAKAFIKEADKRITVGNKLKLKYLENYSSRISQKIYKDILNVYLKRQFFR
jgi:hypothetical protein